MKQETLYNHDDSLDVDLHYCGFLDDVSIIREGPTVRKAFLIHFVTGGKYCIRCEDKSWEAHEGQCFLIVPGKVYYYENTDGTELSYFWFAFNGRTAESYVAEMGLSFEEPIADISAASMNDLKTRISRMYSLSEKHANRAEVLSELYGIVAVMLKESGKSKSDNRANEYVKEALMYIEREFGNYLTTAQIVGYMNLNRSYFSKIFKAYTGLSPQKYLIEFRMQKAMELIRTSELKLSEICKCVGIREEYYFWRLFKRQTGLSPKEYKAKHRSEI